MRLSALAFVHPLNYHYNVNVFYPNFKYSPLRREAFQAQKHTVLTLTFAGNVPKISVRLFWPSQVHTATQMDVRKKEYVGTDVTIVHTRAPLYVPPSIPTGRLPPNEPGGNSESNSPGYHVGFECALPHRKTLSSSSRNESSRVKANWSLLSLSSSLELYHCILEMCCPCKVLVRF